MRNAFAAFAFSTLPVIAADLTPEARFRVEVWPLIERTCLRCHGDEKQKGDLRLDSREAAIKGGESGPALVPGKPAESLMVKLVRHAEEDRKMPPKEKLADHEVASLERWISDGAPWPARPVPIAPMAAKGEKIGDAWSDRRNPIVQTFGGERLDWWSVRPVKRGSVPTVTHSGFPIRSPLDAFILARLQRENVAPAPAADSRMLGRRVYFALTGLPPSPEQMAAFAQAYDAPGADRDAILARTVDQLLASPRYGEHWARMWLDVVRYSDSNGFDWDEFRPQAWRYRDYVIRSFNADKPFDRFLREQLAGDEMVSGPPKDAAEQDCLIATTYLRLGPHDNSAAQFGEGPRVRAALMNDLVETTGAAFMGLTLSCSRCHHHKYDPISQPDYYRLQAFFEGVKFRDDLAIDLAPEQDALARHNAGVEARIAVLRKERDAIAQPVRDRLRSERIGRLSKEKRRALEVPEAKRDAAAKKKIEAIEKEIALADKDVIAALPAADQERHAAADARLQAAKKELRKPTTAMLMADESASPKATHVLFQGDLSNPREAVVPGFLSILDPNPATIISPPREGSSGRRLALANWLAAPEHPLVARVFVNRVWQAYFGEGLVATGNDFGLAGARPSHPELLDWLASEFVRSGWSVKKLHRLIVLSSTFRQGAQDPAVAGRSLFAGHAPRRLTAEALRDSMLAVSGRLLERSGGPPVWPEVPEEVLRANPAFLDDNAEKTKGWYPTPKTESTVRSIYLVQKRTLRVPMMETFDLPENATSCARRPVSTVAPQALTLLNSPFATEMAASFAERLTREVGDSASRDWSLVDRAFLVALQRLPDEAERDACIQFLEKRSVAEFARALLNLNEFAYVD